MPLLARKTPLEPVAPGLIAVVFVHILLGALVWTVLPFWTVEKPVLQEDVPLADLRYWFPPENFKLLHPLPETAPAKTVSIPKSKPAEVIPVAAEPSPSRPTNKIITLSPVRDADPKAVPASDALSPPIALMEVANVEKKQEMEKPAPGSADMDPVLNALEEGLKREWNAPPVQQVPALQRQVAFKLSIGRNGDILHSEMVRSSGSLLLDESVRDAALRLKKISQALPSSFPKDRYTVEVNFHIE